MREDSATQQSANRPRLVAHRGETRTSVEPGISSSSSSEPSQPSNIGSDGYPGRSFSPGDPNQPGRVFRAEPTVDSYAQEAKSDERPDQAGAGNLPGRIRWMETLGESKSLASAAPYSSGQTRHSRPAVASELDLNASLTLSGLIHDARNLVTTLDLYCDLIDVPGVLTPSCQHYAAELRLIAGGSRRILDKLAATDPPRAAYLFSAAGRSQNRETTKPLLDFPASPSISTEPGAGSSEAHPTIYTSVGPETTVTDRTSTSLKVEPTDLAFTPGAFRHVSGFAADAARLRPFVSPVPITNLAEEVLANHNLLSALAGAGITVGLSVYEGKRPISISSDDLTRILVNLTKNAAEAMPQGGHIQIALEEFADRLTLSVSDTGSGLPESSLEEIFTAGYTTHVDLQDSVSGSTQWSAPHRGLGLAIVRSIVAAAGGSVTAANRRDVDAQQPYRPVDGETPISGAVIALNFPLQG